MDFSNPWDYIKIRSLSRKEELQYFDSRIHIVYVLFGECTLKHQDRGITLDKDDFYIFAKTEKYELKVKRGKVFYFTLDYFVKNSSEHYTYAFKGSSVIDPKATDSELIYQLKQLLLLKTMEKGASFSKIFKQYFTLLTLLEHYYQIELKNGDHQSIRGQIEDLTFYIDNNFEKDIRLTDLAEQLYVTEQYLSRVFKEQNGIGISEYLMKCRLAKVRQLLLETEESITDIAFSAGFSNINSFNRIFKKYQGMTPSTYRFEVKNELKVKELHDEMDRQDRKDIRQYLEEENVHARIREVRISQDKKLPFNTEKLMINLGYAGDLLQHSLLKETHLILNYTSFKYGRVWGLLSDKVLRQNGHYFDFSKVDEIIQNILDLGLIPFLELGFKGKQIHKSVDRVVSQENFQLPCNDFPSLLERYRALVQHLISKYGPDEVSAWKIELWKPNSYVLNTLQQPDLALWTHDGLHIDLTQNKDYFYYFTEVRRLLRSLVPDIEVGGSGLSLDLEEKDYRQFLEEWACEAERPDFLSLSFFPLDTLKQNFEAQGSRVLIFSNSDFFRESLNRARQILNEVDLTPQMIVSEFNITNSARDIINDSAFKGPYILKNILPALETCDLIGYWQLSDLSFAAFDVNQKEIFGGGGLVSKNGIAKPSFFAFDFLNSLGDQLLYLSDGIIATQKQSRIIILFYHYCHLSNLYYYSNQENFSKTTIASMFENDGHNQFHVKLTLLDGNLDYKIKIRKIGAAEGSFLTEVNKLSLRDNFSREEINYLKLRCLPSLRREEKRAMDGCLDFQVGLDPHDMVLLEISQ